MGANIYDWSLTAGDNATADSGLTWAEGMAPSAVNNSARVMMERVAELLADIGGALTAGGTANGLTVTANSDFASYANGRILAFKAASDNTGAATLNVNGIGAKEIRRMGSSGDAAVSSGMIQADGVFVVQYSTAADGGSGGWLLLNPVFDGVFQPLDATLTALAAFNTNGLVVQTASDTFAGRTLTGTANEIAITNGDGVSGNPTVSLPSALTFTGKTVTGGTFTGITDLAIADGGTGASSASAAFDNLKQAATTTSTGVVEKSTSGENVAGTSDTVYPSVAGVKEMIDTHAVVSGTVQATTSGTAIDFTSIPAGVTQIIIEFDQVSLSSSDQILVQIGDSGGLETTGYASSASRFAGSGTTTTSTSGFPIYTNSAGDTVSGHMTLTNITGDVWVESHVGLLDTGSEASMWGGGRKALTGTLDRLRITRNGSNTFDNGQVNIKYS